MTFSLQCDRCKKHSQNDREYNDFRQLDYYKKHLGHYSTIHLCQRCIRVFQENFMRGRLEPEAADPGRAVCPPEQG